MKISIEGLKNTLVALLLQLIFWNYAHSQGQPNPKPSKSTVKGRGLAPAADHHHTSFLKNETWPDFRCVPGWYDEDSRDASHPLAESRSSGAKLLKEINANCEKSVRGKGDQDEALDTCKVSCIMEQLGLFTKSPEGHVTPADVDSFIDAFTIILTDKGGFGTVGDVDDELYPKFNNSAVWENISKAAGACQDASWTTLQYLIDDFIEIKATKSCKELLRADEYSDYLENNYITYTASLDLSCYDDFVYKGIDTGEGDMVPFMDITNECTDFLSRKGVKEECHAICMFNKMGLFSWEAAWDTTDPEGSLHDSVSLASNLTKFFSGPRKLENLKEPSERLYNECKEIFDKVKAGSCSQMKKFEDCIERALSCNYTGRFLNSTDLDGRNDNADPSGVTEYKGYPDMSCRQGYLKSVDPNKGSGLLRKYNLICQTLVQNGYYKCEQLCMLDQMGILAANGTEFNGAVYNNHFIFNDEQEITLRLKDVFADFGGWDTAYEIASGVVKDCTETLESLDQANCNSSEWTQFSCCVARAMECKASALFGKESPEELSFAPFTASDAERGDADPVYKPTPSENDEVVLRGRSMKPAPAVKKGGGNRGSNNKKEDASARSMKMKINKSKIKSKSKG